MCSKSPEADPVRLYRDFMAACAKSPRILERWGQDLSGPEQAFVEDHLRPGPVLLAGCGHGRGIGWLLSRGRRVEAVDRDAGMCALTRRTFAGQAVSVHQAELANLKMFAGRRFSTIVCLGLVSGGLLLPGGDRRAALAGLSAVLSEDGVLLLDFLDAGPGVRGWVQRFDYPVEGDLRVPGCCYWPTREEVQSTLWAAGLRCALVELDRDPDAPLVGVAASFSR